MRHHSQRVPGKNYRLLAGRPLFHHIVETLQDVAEIDLIAVDTDSEEIALGLHTHFPSVEVLRRPPELRADDVSMNEILLHDTGRIVADFYLQTHSTNPLLRAETVSRAIRSFLAAHPAHDSLFSVTRLQTRLYDSMGKAINHNPRELLQTQDLSPVFEENSCLYMFSRESLSRRRHRIGETPLMVEMDAQEAWDIDDELDFAICECLIGRGGPVSRAKSRNSPSV
jgi:CMP-N-acetylneuraminic acid synthetase